MLSKRKRYLCHCLCRRCTASRQTSTPVGKRKVSLWLAQESAAARLLKLQARSPTQSFSQTSCGLRNRSDIDRIDGSWHLVRVGMRTRISEAIMNHRCAPFSAPPCCSSSAPTPLLGTWRPAARLFPHRLNSHRLTALSQLPVKLPPAPTPPTGSTSGLSLQYAARGRTWAIASIIEGPIKSGNSVQTACQPCIPPSLLLPMTSSNFLNYS